MFRAAVALLLWAIAIGAQGATFLQWASQPGDFVGQGGSGTISDANFAFTVQLAGTSPVNGVNIYMQSNSPVEFESARFLSPLGTALAVGTYLNAERGFGPSPGIDVSLGGRGCDTVYGKFTVLELVSGPGPVQFAADFEQHCEGVEPALYGSIRINSSIPAHVSPPVPAGPGFFAYESMPGDYLGQGQATELTRSDGYFAVTQDGSGGARVLLRALPGTTSFGFWDFSISPAAGQALVAGTYEGAQRNRFNAAGHPGLDLSGNGRGCNSVTGRFTVLEIEPGPDSTFSKLAVDFELHCEGAAPAFYGSIRFNSTIAANLPLIATSLQRVGSSSAFAVRSGHAALGPKVTALSSSNQPVPGVLVTFSIQGSCGTLQGTQSVQSLTDASGVATASPFLAGAMLGWCEVDATLPSSTQDVETSYLIFDPSQLVLTPMPAMLTLTAGQPFQVGVQISLMGYLLDNVSVTFSETGGNAGVLPSVIGSQGVTDTNGYAFVNGVAGTVAGQYTITITAEGATQTIAMTQDGIPPAPPAPPVPPPPFTESVDLQDMWWNPSENGWGMSLIQHGDTLFGAVYAYDASGNPTWFVMPGGSWDAAHLAYTGALYTPKGTPFFAYDASREVVGSAVGIMTLTFQDANNAIVDYTIGGISGHKLVTREIFANGTGTKPDRSDLWWGGNAQNGWGITILQQADTLFPVWFTYDAGGKATWYVMPVGSWTASDTYAGEVYRTTGSAWVGAIYDPTKLVVTQAGTYSIQFNGDAATFAYVVDGHSGTIPLVREPF